MFFQLFFTRFVHTDFFTRVFFTGFFTRFCSYVFFHASVSPAYLWGRRPPPASGLLLAGAAGPWRSMALWDAWPRAPSGAGSGSNKEARAKQARAKQTSEEALVSPEYISCCSVSAETVSVRWHTAGDINLLLSPPLLCRVKNLYCFPCGQVSGMMGSDTILSYFASHFAAGAGKPDSIFEF